VETLVWAILPQALPLTGAVPRPYPSHGGFPRVRFDQNLQTSRALRVRLSDISRRFVQGISRR
jgi:hypothetical protein